METYSVRELMLFCIKKSNLLFTLTLLVFFNWTSSIYALNVKKVFEDTRPSVILIMAFDDQDEPLGLGSGFFFGDSNTIATNLHVVKNASKLLIKLSNGDVGQLTSVLGIDTANDLALLTSTVKGEVIVGAERLPAIGEDIIAIGNPKGLEGTVSSGIVSGIRTDKTGQWIQITAPISPGSSGGPVVDEDGYLLGVTTFYVGDGQNLNGIIPTAYLTKLYHNKNKATLASLKVKSKKKIKTAIGNVRIAHIAGRFTGSSNGDKLEFSIVNKSQEAIKNIAVKMTYFCRKKSKDGDMCDNSDNTTPIHKHLFKIEETVLPNTSLRFKRNFLSNFNYSWRPEAVIFDYDIIPSSSSGTTLTFD